MYKMYKKILLIFLLQCGLFFSVCASAGIIEATKPDYGIVYAASLGLSYLLTPQKEPRYRLFKKPSAQQETKPKSTVYVLKWSASPDAFLDTDAIQLDLCFEAEAYPQIVADANITKRVDSETFNTIYSLIPVIDQNHKSMIISLQGKASLKLGCSFLTVNRNPNFVVEFITPDFIYSKEIHKASGIESIPLSYFLSKENTSPRTHGNCCSGCKKSSEVSCSINYIGKSRQNSRSSMRSNKNTNGGRDGNDENDKNKKNNNKECNENLSNSIDLRILEELKEALHRYVNSEVAVRARIYNELNDKLPISDERISPLVNSGYFLRHALLLLNPNNIWRPILEDISRQESTFNIFIRDIISKDEIITIIHTINYHTYMPNQEYENAIAILDEIIEQHDNQDKSEDESADKNESVHGYKPEPSSFNNFTFKEFEPSTSGETLTHLPELDLMNDIFSEIKGAPDNALKAFFSSDVANDELPPLDEDDSIDYL